MFYPPFGAGCNGLIKAAIGIYFHYMRYVFPIADVLLPSQGLERERCSKHVTLIIVRSQTEILCGLCGTGPCLTLDFL